MPRFPKPWFRKERQAWFVQVDGRQINLGPDRELALKRYHALMNEPKRPRVSAESVVALCDLFLDWCEKHRSRATYEWYRDRLQAFAKTIPPDLKAAMLRPFHVQAWIDSQAQWSNGSKRNGCRAVQRAMHWAEQQGYLGRSPIWTSCVCAAASPGTWIMSFMKNRANSSEKVLSFAPARSAGENRSPRRPRHR